MKMARDASAAASRAFEPSPRRTRRRRRRSQGVARASWTQASGLWWRRSSARVHAGGDDGRVLRRHETPRGGCWRTSRKAGPARRTGGRRGGQGAGKRKISHPAVDDEGGAPTPKRAAGARGTVRGTDRGTVAAVAAPRAGMTMTTTNAAAVAAALRAGRTVLVTGAAVAALTNPAAAAALARRSRPTAEDAQVALRLGELCATVGVDVTPEMIDRFRDDLSRCPESVRSLLAPLARGVDPIIAPLRALLRFNAPRAEGTEAGTAAAEDTEAGTAAATPAPAAAPLRPLPPPPRPARPRGPRPRPRGPRPRPCGPRPARRRRNKRRRPRRRPGHLPRASRGSLARSLRPRPPRLGLGR